MHSAPSLDTMTATTTKEETTNTNNEEEEESYNSSNRVTLVLLLGGLPGAGKSTLAAAWQKALPSLLHCVEYDGLEQGLLLEAAASASANNNDDNNNNNNDDDDATLQEQQRLDAWKQSRTLALDRLRDLLRRANSAASPAADDDDNNKQEDAASSSSLGAIQQIILMDDNYYLRSMRKQVFLTCQQVVAERQGDAQIAMVSAWLDTPVDTCLARNEARTRQVPRQVIERMARQMERPEHEGNDATISNQTGYTEPQRRPYWEKVAWQLNGSASVEFNTQFLWQQLRQQRQQRHWLPLCMVPPPVDPQVELDRLAAERQRTASNLRHQTDQALRQAVKMVATEISPKHARAANAARKRVLTASDALEQQGGLQQAIMESFYLELLQEATLNADEEIKLQTALFQDQSW